MEKALTTKNGNLEANLGSFLQNQISLNTRSTYGRALERYFNWCREHKVNPKGISFEDALAYRQSITEDGFSASSSALHISALKSFYKTMKDVGLTDSNVWAAVKAPSAPKTSQTRPLDPEQLRALYAKAEEAGPRDMTIVRLLYEAAMRREEVAALPKDALVHGPDGWALAIKGKGDKDVTVGITDDLAGVIVIQAQSSEGKWLFPGRTPDKHLDKRQINNILDQFGIHPHQLRHSLVTNLLKQGNSIHEVSRAVRHENIQTTMRYYDERERVVNSALRKLAPVRA